LQVKSSSLVIDHTGDLMKDLKKRTVQGGIANLLSQGANFFIRIVSLMALSRLLDPKDFGLVAMVTAITGVFSIFTAFGLSSATVQRDTVTDEQVSTLFWINLLVGAILALLCLVTAPILVAFYHEPRLFWVTVAMSSGFLINAAGVQHSALLQREIRFVALTVIDLIANLVSTALAISMALGGLGYWALVGSIITYTAIGTIGKWVAAAWIPGKPHRRIGIRSMIGFGGTITLNTLVTYIAYNLQKVLLGRVGGADVLGLYGRADSFINIPTQTLNTAIGSVAFSALARLQNEPDMQKRYFLKGYSLVMSMTLPIALTCAMFADDLIFVFLGPKWKEAVIIFRLLAPTVLIFGMINPLGWMLMSSGLQVRSLKIAMVIAPLTIFSYYLGLPYGAKGVAFAYSAAMTLLLVPTIMWCIHGTLITLWDIVQVIGKPFLSCIAAAIFAFGFQFFCGQSLPPFLRLLLRSSVMFVFYLLFLLFVMGQKTFYLNLVRGMRKAPTPVGQDSLEAPV
jgi:O-antigen/teichoic acid export membrane protein